MLCYYCYYVSLYHNVMFLLPRGFMIIIRTGAAARVKWTVTSVADTPIFAESTI